MSEEEKKDNPGFVTHGEFAPVVSDVEHLQGEVNVIKLALFGADGRGGIVKDIASLKSTIETKVGELKTTIETANAVTTYKFAREVILPIAIVVIAALILRRW